MISFRRNKQPQQTLTMCEVMFVYFYKGRKEGVEGYKPGCKHGDHRRTGKWEWRETGAGKGGSLYVLGTVSPVAINIALL